MFHFSIFTFVSLFLFLRISHCFFSLIYINILFLIILVVTAHSIYMCKNTVIYNFKTILQWIYAHLIFPLLHSPLLFPLYVLLSCSLSLFRTSSLLWPPGFLLLAARPFPQLQIALHLQLLCKFADTPTNTFKTIL